MFEILLPGWEVLANTTAAGILESRLISFSFSMSASGSYMSPRNMLAFEGLRLQVKGFCGSGHFIGFMMKHT